MNYLGVKLDNKHSFVESIWQVVNKAAEVTASLSRIMINVRGTRTCMLRQLMHTAEFITLVDGEIWIDTFWVKKSHIAEVQGREAFRMVCSYRMVSEHALLVVTIWIKTFHIKRKSCLIQKRFEGKHNGASVN